MPLGAHLPTSKGFEAALRHAQDLDCDCLQIFSKSPRQWNAAPLDPAKAELFRSAWKASGFAPLVAHDSYLINLAAPDEAILRKSIDAMINEVERADSLGCDWLVTHCGAHLQRPEKPKKGKTPDQSTLIEEPACPPMSPAEEVALQRLADSLKEVIEATPHARVRIALENTAAQGTCLGGPFEHLAFVLQQLPAERFGVCFDTCHAFAAGHDLTSPEQVQSTLKQFDTIVGLDRVGVVHLNDSKGELGKHLDRHAHIGEGLIGRDSMRAILTHPQLQDKPFILETPEVETMIETNLNMVRELQGKIISSVSAAPPADSHDKPAR
jgi:deoxyribonuclease-4